MKKQNIWIATAAFAGGFLAGIAYASQPGRDARHALLDQARSQGRRLGDQMRAIETQLASLEKQIQASGDQLAQKVKEATSRAVEHYVPGVGDEEGAWEIDRSELERDLPRMPHQ